MTVAEVFDCLQGAALRAHRLEANREVVSTFRLDDFAQGRTTEEEAEAIDQYLKKLRTGAWRWAVAQVLAIGFLATFALVVLRGLISGVVS